MIQTQTERFRYMTGKISDHRLDATFQEHLDIIRACLRNDWKEAAEQSTVHLEESKKATFQLIFNSISTQSLTL